MRGMNVERRTMNVECRNFSIKTPFGAGGRDLRTSGQFCCWL